ncbi:hypothetical protein WJX73_002437 [Symbiochloris irregularis]|uniref:N-acetyltransferase domain-containing protein n=1 Tax=Symbiochloris irregularis TaxID=706552 RepID=A0AAW1NPE4_9CHLO
MLQTPLPNTAVLKREGWRRLRQSLLYQDSIYRQCIQAGDTTQLAFHAQVLIGAIACRLEADQNGGASLYIVSLGVLAPYRNSGIGTRLLHRSLDQARTDSNITACYLHVQISNKDAIRFYTRQGFTVGPVITNYYRRIEPRDAVMLSKPLW